MLRLCNTGHGQRHRGGYYEFPNILFHKSLSIFQATGFGRFARILIKL
jgi:hypothetical protein